jgi:hypothetical protein
MDESSCSLLVHEYMTGVLLQLVAHSWIASALFMVIGDVYEVHGSRAAASLHTTGAGASLLLMLLLANSAFVPTMSVLEEHEYVEHDVRSTMDVHGFMSCSRALEHEQAIIPGIHGR